MSIEGEGTLLLTNEAGGHRIQRIPPTERKGRVHTSTVTVSVLSTGAADISGIAMQDKDLRIEWFSGSGAGGQHRNKHQNCCRLIHVPTGLVQTANGRERSTNLREARSALSRRLQEAAGSSLATSLNLVRKGQVGSGMRGDKRRTYRFRDDRVVDHVTGASATCSEVLAGGMDKLWFSLEEK